MDEPNAFPGRHDGPDPQRRTLLTGLTTADLVSYVPSTLAQLTDDATHDAFMAVSRILTGRPILDPDQAARLYDALVAEAPGFPADVQALRSSFDERRIDPAQLHSILDAEQSPLSVVPRSIVKAWYSGIVGEASRPSRGGPSPGQDSGCRVLFQRQRCMG